MFTPPRSATVGFRGVFVAGTDTEVGKTVVASSIAATLSVRGERVGVFKPVVTGLDEVPPSQADHELLRMSAGSREKAEWISPYRFGPAASPHLAAELAGTRIDPARLLQYARHAAQNSTVLVAEGVGGLMVPLTPHYLVRDLAVDLGMPVIIVARSGLGTINHTLLTIEAARAAGLQVSCVVLSPWPERANDIERSNRFTIASRGKVAVHGMPIVDLSEGCAKPLTGSLGDSLLDAIPAPDSSRAAA